MSRPTRDCLGCKRVATLEDDLYRLAEWEYSKAIYNGGYEKHETDFAVQEPYIECIDNDDWLASEEERIFTTKKGKSCDN